MINNDFSRNDSSQMATRAVTFFLLILVFLVLVLSISMSRSRDRRVDEIPSNVVMGTIKNEIIKNPFADLDIEAKSVIVWDITRGRAIFERSADQKLPLASLTKLVTAAVALENVPAFTTISVDKKSLAADGDTGLHSGEQFNIKDLLKMVLVSSSNDGARAIASAIGSTLPHDISQNETGNEDDIEAFVGEMNKFGEKNGLIGSSFKNEHGLDISKDEDAGRGSARDVAILFGHLLKNHSDVLESTSVAELTIYSTQGSIHKVKNTNRSIDLIPGILASKTGYTELAGGNVAVVTSPGLAGPFAIVILDSSYDGRFTDLEKLSAATLEYLNGSI